jgi:hypothetical protein
MPDLIAGICKCPPERLNKRARDKSDRGTAVPEGWHTPSPSHPSTLGDQGVAVECQVTERSHLPFQTHKKVGLRIIAYWCVRDSEAGLLWRAHEVYMLILVLVLPLTVMAFCYTTICWEIWRVMKRRYHMTSRHA